MKIRTQTYFYSIFNSEIPGENIREMKLCKDHYRVLISNSLDDTERHAFSEPVSTGEFAEGPYVVEMGSDKRILIACRYGMYVFRYITYYCVYQTSL